MRIHVKSLDEIRDRLRVYRPMSLYQSTIPQPMHQCRCAPLFTNDKDAIFWYDNDGHLIECILGSRLDMRCFHGEVITVHPGNDIRVWTDKYNSIDELLTKCIIITDNTFDEDATDE